MENTSLSIYAPETFATIKEVATALSNSDLVPAHFQKKPANVLLALEFAHRNNIAPFAAMQSMFVISGKVGMSASMAISLARTKGAWKSLRYVTKGEGENMSVTATATLQDGEQVSQTVTMKMAIADGWTKNPKYRSLPELMLQYRAATFLIRTHFPEVLSGLQTVEELRDVDAANGPGRSVIDVSPVVVQTQIEATAPKIVAPVEEKKAPKKAPPPPPPSPAPSVPEIQEADESEMKYLTQLCDKFQPRSPDPDVEEMIQTIRTSRIRAGAARVLHVSLLAAVEGKGINDLQSWMKSAIVGSKDKQIEQHEQAIPF